MPTDSKEHLDLRVLLRLASWGGGAALALILAVIATRSDTGSQRIAHAFSGTQTAQLNSEAIARAKAAEEARRLADNMRGLAADRDRLLARVTVLERNLEDVTGSIARGAEPRPDANPESSPLPAANSIGALTGPTTMGTAVTTTTVPAAPIASSAALRKPAPAATSRFPTAAALPPAVDADGMPTGSTGTTSEFGVDIGGGTNIAALRDLWNSAHNNHGAALAGLRPVVSVRDGSKPGSVELRLIAGPLNNAAAAAKICAALAAGGWSCKPALFDGQKLALR